MLQRSVRSRLARLLFLLPLSVVLICILGCANSGPVSDRLQLTILHTNDWHGSNADLLARQTTLINSLRSQSTNLLLLNGGDVFARGKYHYFFFGELEFAVMNLQKTDALVPGNHEFTATGDALESYDILKKRFAQSRFAVLAANVTRKQDGRYIQNSLPYVVVKRGGVRIGIIGITTCDHVSTMSERVLDFADGIESAKRIYPEVAAKADIVIALTHIGFNEDKRLAAALPGLAAVIGAHSHSELLSPLIEGEVPIVQAGSFGVNMGRLDLSFEREGGRWILRTATRKLIPVKDFEPDPATLKLYRKYESRL